MSGHGHKDGGAPGGTSDIRQDSLKPGDQAPPGTPGAGENVCRHCGGSGRMPDGSTCTVCEGTGVVTEEIGGA